MGIIEMVAVTVTHPLTLTTTGPGTAPPQRMIDACLRQRKKPAMQASFVRCCPNRIGICGSV